MFDVRLGEGELDSALPDHFMRWHFDPFPITMGMAFDSEYKTEDNTALYPFPITMGMAFDSEYKTGDNTALYPFPITMGMAFDSEYKTGGNTVLLNEHVVVEDQRGLSVVDERDEGDEGRRG